MADLGDPVAVVAQAANDDLVREAVLTALGVDLRHLHILSVRTHTSSITSHGSQQVWSKLTTHKVLYQF